MGNAVVKLLGVMIGVLLLFLYPILESYQRQDDLAAMYVQRSASAFSDAVRDKGVITPVMWNDFMAEMEQTGNVYDVVVEHYEKKYDPIYRDPVQANTFRGDYLIRYQLNNKVMLMEKLFPGDGQIVDSPSRTYKLSIGDYFFVSVSNTNRTRAAMIMDWLTGSFGPTERIRIPVGGMVRNESS